MKDFLKSLFSRYRRQGVLIDTNILLLYFVGTVNRERISQFNRTEKFTPEDYDLLQRMMQQFQKIVTTPNILTEVSNLINQIKEPERSQCFLIFTRLTQGVLDLDEIYIESKSVTAVEKFSKFGLTDCGILNLAKKQYLVLTDDFKLANYLESEGIDVINFNHVRTWGWG